MFLAETRGYTNLDLTIEDVRDHEVQIADPSGYHRFGSSVDINESLARDLQAAGAEPVGDVVPVHLD
ncbi:hypothetical protein [Nocardioides sp. AN3]